MLRLRGGGVKGLHSLLEAKLPSDAHTTTLSALADEAFRSKLSCTIVVDGMALIRKLYTPELEWVVGGQYQELFMHVESFVKAFAAFGLKLVVFIDGGVDDAKLAEWQGRRVKDLQKVDKVVAALARYEEPPRGAWMPPPNISKAVGGAFAQHGCEVYYTAGEADRELASYCSSRGCCGVLAKDSDFFILPVAMYLNLDTLQLYARPPTVAVYRRAAVEDALSLPSPLLPLLGSLVGNDFVPTALLERYHQHLLPGRHATGSQLIDAVAKHVGQAAGAAGWRGPRPMTPLLWCALDWGGRLSDDARSLVERSLEQYAVEDGFEELPAALLERASGVSSAMLKRFRRGELDATVFTAATRLAIWRGPSVDDPDASPTILASRPIRCEMYAACIKAAAASASIVVSEYVIYSSQPVHGSAESVTVPPRLSSCESMWAMPPAQRCSCLLRALGRASRNDSALASLDPTSIMAFGPLSLALLAARFLRRHGLASRVVALVMLCQGLVMAWLSATRQRMPAELRKRPRTVEGRQTLKAAHFASLFTRVSTDIGVLNSACGQPLLLHGPWEWFDGVLFESLLVRAASASAAKQAANGADGCWPGLLRGDAALFGVFELLRPLAEADDVAAASVAAAVDPGGQLMQLEARAAVAWKKAIAS